MTTMNVETDYAETVATEMRPHGHVFIRSNNAFDLQPIYWGEIVLKGDMNETNFFYKVENFSVDDKSYTLTLYTDREFQEYFLGVQISFTNENPLNIQKYLVYRSEQLRSIPSELIDISHILICKGLVSITNTSSPKEFGENAAILLNTGFVIGIRPLALTFIENVTRFPFESLVSKLDRVLG